MSSDLYTLRAQPTPGVFDPALPKNIDFVAMQFSGLGIANLMSAVATASPPVTALLTFNEPNLSSQVPVHPGSDDDPASNSYADPP